MKIPTKCPICNGEMYIETIKCKECGTAVTNKFAMSKFDKLTESQVDFVLTFLGVEGNIKDMEKALGISYPTVKSRLSEIQQALNLNEKSKAERQLDILSQIESGSLSVEEAVKMLKKEN